jgi:hypothetical protein
MDPNRNFYKKYVQMANTIQKRLHFFSHQRNVNKSTVRGLRVWISDRELA